MVTDRNTKLIALLLGLVGILMSLAAVAEDRILVTTEFPSEGDADVQEQTRGFDSTSSRIRPNCSSVALIVSFCPSLPQPQRCPPASGARRWTKAK